MQKFLSVKTDIKKGKVETSSSYFPFVIYTYNIALKTNGNGRCYSESHRQRGSREGGNRASRESSGREETDQLHNLDNIDKVANLSHKLSSTHIRLKMGTMGELNTLRIIINIMLDGCAVRRC